MASPCLFVLGLTVEPSDTELLAKVVFGSTAISAAGYLVYKGAHVAEHLWTTVEAGLDRVIDTWFGLLEHIVRRRAKLRRLQKKLESRRRRRHLPRSLARFASRKRR